MPETKSWIQTAREMFKNEQMFMEWIESNPTRKKLFELHK